MAASRREQILSTAADLFAERGFHGVSVADLGAACGISGPALYRHFPSKDAMLAEMLVSISEELLEVGRERVKEADDPREALHALAMGMWAAREEIASGRPDEAVAHARRLVALQPWDENCHELLVRALAQSGDALGARAHVRLVTESFLDELGVAPSRSLSAAAEPMMARPAQANRTRTEAQLQADP